MSAETTTPYKTVSINNRRYLGNKYKLLPFLTGVVGRECTGVRRIADLFAGTGAVASAFPDQVVITNDLMYSNYICHYAWFGPEPYDPDRLLVFLRRYNSPIDLEENYMTRNFADTYFTRADCARIGFIREDIEQNYRAGRLNQRERALLITSLLYAMDKIALTCGHYDAYRKNASHEGSLELALPLASVHPNPQNLCFNEDANNLVKRLEADLVYIDPPYNSRQYCDSYHLLENVARWEKPQVFGVARKMDRTGLKSRYCTTAAPRALETLVNDIKAKYILLSYNNMAQRGNCRSNAKISDEDILHILSQKGSVKVFEENYKAFTTGRSNLPEHTERLFLCTCFQEE